MKKTVYIVIGCDTDPDRKNFFDDVPTDTLSWRGMLEGIPVLKERFKSIFDSTGNQPVLSWCLRVDHQIKKIYGSYNYILSQHRDFFEQLESEGDELAWHPHFFRHDEKQDLWYQEFLDSEWQMNMLNEAYAAYQEVLPGRAKSVRMGWDYHNNETFRTLQDLGVQVDFSGIPGLRLDPQSTDTRSVNFFDWSLAPNRPYYPSTTDYRREVGKGEISMRLLESPNFVSKSFMWGLISGAVLAKKMRNLTVLLRAFRRPTYWIATTGKPKYFAPLIAQVERTLRSTNKIVFVTYFHPDELVKNNSSLYSIDNMVDNISVLVSKVQQFGAEVKFIRAIDIEKHYYGKSY